MSIKLSCDQCGKDSWHLNEIRTVSVQGDEVYREFSLAHLCWECIVPWVNRRDAEKEEIPF